MPVNRSAPSTHSTEIPAAFDCLANLQAADRSPSSNCCASGAQPHTRAPDPTSTCTFLFPICLLPRMLEPHWRTQVLQNNSLGLRKGKCQSWKPWPQSRKSDLESPLLGRPWGSSKNAEQNLSTGTGCPKEKLWSLLLWRCSKPAWLWSCATCCVWPCYSRGAGADGLWRALPTSPIPWFCVR